MRTWKIWSFLLAFLLPFTTALSQTRTKPLDEKIDKLFPAKQKSYLTDVAKVVKNPREVEARLMEIREKDRLNFAAVTLPTIGDRNIADVAREIGRKWLVATKNDTVGAAVKNTGVVILLVLDIHTCRLELASGTERYLTDGSAAEICRSATANFRSGDFGGGLILIANSVADKHREELAREREAKLPKPPKAPSKPLPWLTIFIWVFLGGSAVTFFVRRSQQKARERRREEERLIAEERQREYFEERKRAREELRRREEAAEKERQRRAGLTQAERDAEDREAERLQRERAAEARRQAALDEQRRKADEERRKEEEANRPIQTHTYDDDDDDSSSRNTFDSSPSSPGSDDNGFSVGGADPFNGAGGESTW